MAKATIRGNSSQSRMAAPALHSIILSNDAAETTTIQHYFRTKKLHGTCAVAKPVLSKDVVTNLQAMLKGGSEKSSTVSCVVMCLEEFSTNYQVREPWNECSDEIAQLVYDCLVYFIELKRNDRKQKTTNFEDLSRSFMKLCYVIYYLAEKSKDLSTKLLKRCSKDLMIILICKDTKEGEIRAVLLQALSSLCKYAKTAEIHQTFSGLSIYLGCLAKMVLDLPVETQMDAYTVLRSSLVTKDDAIKMATIWFSKWPMIRDVFTESFSLNFSKGCGTFLNTLHKVKSLADKSFSTCSLASFTRNIQMDTTANSSASHLVDTDLIVSSKGTAKTARNEIMVPQNNCIPNIATNVPNAAPAMTVDKSQKDTMSVFKTPFHPDYRKKASLHKTKMESIQTVVSKQAEQLSCEGGLRFPETPSVGSEMPLAKCDRSSKRISSKKLETQITKGEIVVSNNPSNETKMPNAGPVVSAGETPRNSKSKQYQTPYYPDHRKSLSLRKRENKSTASENLAEQSAKNVLNYLEGPNSVKPNIGNLGSTVETEKPISLKPKRESNKIGRISKASEEPSLSNLSSEDQSSKVERWLSLQVPDDGFDNVTDDEKGFGDNNHKNSDKRDTYSQKRTLSKQVKDDSPLVSFSSNIGVNNLENKSMKKTRLGKRPVHLNSTANDFGKGSPSAKKKKTNSTTDSSVSHPNNMWEKRLEELETRRAEEKRNSIDIYCFNVSVPSAPLKTKGVPAKNCVLNKKSPIFNQKSERAKSSKSKQSLEINKENVEPIDQPHPFNVISKSSSFSIKNPQFLQTSKLSYLIEEEKEMGSHTSDLISTKNVKFVTEAKFSKEKKKEVKSYPHEFFPNKSIRTAQPTTSSFPREEKTEVQSRTTGLKSTNPNRSEKKQYFTPAPLKSPDSYKDKSTEKYFSPVLDDSMEMKKTGMEKQEKAALGDSGFEVTSGSDGGSRSNYKKQSSKSEYLKTFLRANLQKALEANTDIVSKNETITSEMSEIQNLAEKIAKSAGRCMVTNRENCQLLRKQGNALEGCSKYMSSYENHPSQSQEPTVSYMNYQAFKRNLKERSRQRTIEALKKALEASYSSSSSDDELQ